jgi:hypothetical protein
MRREVRRLLTLVDRAERILIGVERYFGIDDEALPAGLSRHRAAAAAVAIGDAPSVWKSACSESRGSARCAIAARPSARARARCGALTSFAASLDTLGALAHGRSGRGADRSVLAFRLDLADRFFIFLETVVDR